MRTVGPIYYGPLRYDDTTKTTANQYYRDHRQPISTSTPLSPPTFPPRASPIQRTPAPNSTNTNTKKCNRSSEASDPPSTLTPARNILHRPKPHIRGILWRRKWVPEFGKKMTSVRFQQYEQGLFRYFETRHLFTTDHDLSIYRSDRS